MEGRLEGLRGLRDAMAALRGDAVASPMAFRAAPPPPFSSRPPPCWPNPPPRATPQPATQKGADDRPPKQATNGKGVGVTSLPGVRRPPPPPLPLRFALRCVIIR
eukprot:COSAG01_NODE_16060_length_1274_cov_0.921702_1_plen_104_part_10